MRRPRKIMPFAQAAQPVYSTDSTRSHPVTCLPAQLSFHSAPPYHLPPYFTGAGHISSLGKVFLVHRTQTQPTLRARLAARLGILIKEERGGRSQGKKDPLDHILRLRAQTWQRPHHGACASQDPICCFQNGFSVDV